MREIIDNVTYRGQLGDRKEGTDEVIRNKSGAKYALRSVHAVMYCNILCILCVPMEALKDGVSTSLGTGMMISTLLAMERDLNWDFVLIMYSMRLLLCGSTTASTQINGFTGHIRDENT